MTVGLRSCFFKEALCNYDMTVGGLRFVRFDMIRLSAPSLGSRNMSEPACFSKEAPCSCDMTIGLRSCFCCTAWCNFDMTVGLRFVVLHKLRAILT